MATGLLIERGGLVATRLPELPRKNGRGYVNPGSDYDRCCVPPIQLDCERGCMRILQGLIVRAGQAKVSYVEGDNNVGTMLGIYQNPDKGSVTLVHRPNGAAVQIKEFERLGIGFRVLYKIEKI